MTAKKKVDPGFSVAHVPIPKTPEYFVAELRHDSKIAYSLRGFP